MPPAQKSATKDLLPIGSVVSIVSGGRTLHGYTVLDKDSKFILFTADPHVAPQTETVLIPYEKLEIVGLPRA